MSYPMLMRNVARIEFVRTKLAKMKVTKILLAAGTLGAALLSAQQPVDSATTSQASPLPLEQIVKNLEERNAQRAAALSQFEGERVYRMQYRGFPSNREAEMVIKVSYRAPDSKEFSVVSQTGSKFIIDHVFKKLLEGEKEAANADNRSRTALTHENYDFKLAAYEPNANGGQYVLDLLPKTSNKFLYRGRIWVDARDFAAVRIEGEPGKNPSFWIKRTEINHKYLKVNDFWLPEENRTESVIRLGGTATLSIEYRDYKILKAGPLNSATNTSADSQSATTAGIEN